MVCEDALFYEWPRADAIIGNPPFLGGSRIRLELSDDYADRVFKKFSNIRAQVDFASYWFRLAHEHIGENGRAGLVATNSISQGKSRSVSLDYVIKNNGYIHEAISTQVWSGQANVHVSLINWSKREPNVHFLDNSRVSRINSSLSALVDVSEANHLKSNLKFSFVGVQTNSKGFYIDEELSSSWIKSNNKNSRVLKFSTVAKDLTENPSCKPTRWIVDFADMSIEEVSQYKLPLNHIKQFVKPERDVNREAVLREKWWRFKRTNEAMRVALSSLKLCFAAPRVSKWFIFIPVNASSLPTDSTTIVACEDLYILGILTSKIHRDWVKAQSSTLKGDTRYTPTTCFETFPFPQTPSEKIVQKIRQTAIDLHDYRSQMMEKHQYGITKLYNQFFHEPTSQLAKLHKQLDQLTLQAYGFSETDDILEQLLNLNLQLAAQEQTGATIVGPYDPHNPPQRKP